MMQKVKPFNSNFPHEIFKCFKIKSKEIVKALVRKFITYRLSANKPVKLDSLCKKTHKVRKMCLSEK